MATQRAICAGDSIISRPLQLGAPFTDWKAPAVMSAIRAIEEGGIVELASDRSPYGATIDSIALDFAGPCSAIRAEVWLADTATAPFPLGAIGTSAAALAKRAGSNHVRSRAPGMLSPASSGSLVSRVQDGRAMGQ